MTMPTKIEWCDETWSPIIGCSKVSAGCDNCYAEKQAVRVCHCLSVTQGDQSGGTWAEYSSVLNWGGDEPEAKALGWNGKTAIVSANMEKPLHWKKPRIIFVCPMGDLFHESVPFELIDRVFTIMAQCPQHTIKVLTKRPGRMLEYYKRLSPALDQGMIELPRHERLTIGDFRKKTGECFRRHWPLPNVHIGVSVEDQATADERIPLLLECPAAVRFISAEPLLGPIDFSGAEYHQERWTCVKMPAKGCGWSGMPPESTYDDHCFCYRCPECGSFMKSSELPCIDQIIVGGESGPNARPMHPDWVRSIRDQCVAAGVPFFFKQWGEWSADREKAGVQWSTGGPLPQHGEPGTILTGIEIGGRDHGKPTAWAMMGDGSSKQLYRVGKKKAGRILDGQTWDEQVK
ncbi:MAG: phage Gp37/Gp68 family protein [FCB group bacterium]|nr:phage Gp37/Gp68 family protein [FCB group bacterium]